MTSDSLNQLLAHTDAATPPPSGGMVDLAAVVRSRSVRRSRARVIGSATVAGTACLATVFMTIHRPPARDTIPTIQTADVAQLRAEVASFESEANRHAANARTIERVLSVVRMRGLNEKAIANDPSEQVQFLRESAAAVLVHQAEDFAAKPGKKDLSRDAYDRAATLFSDTAGGRQARANLREGA